jgi:hypothetical protein
MSIYSALNIAVDAVLTRVGGADSPGRSSCYCPKGVNPAGSELKKIAASYGFSTIDYLSEVANGTIAIDAENETLLKSFLPLKYLDYYIEKLPSEVKAMPPDRRAEFILLALALSHKESCFDRKCVSKRGAYGVMQVKVEAAHEVGLKVEDGRKLLHPPSGIQAGMRYLYRMMYFYYDYYHVNVSISPEIYALAAYNKGPSGGARFVNKYADDGTVIEKNDYTKNVYVKWQLYDQLYYDDILVILQSRGKKE